MATHDMVAHAWAHGLDKCRNGHHMSHGAGIIYSYGAHWPIARRLENGDVLFREGGACSVSTAKHHTITRRAIVGACFYVPDIRARSKREHALNLASYQTRIDALLASAKRRRKVSTRAYDLEEASRLYAEGKHYSTRFKLGAYKQPAFPLWAQDMLATLEEERAEEHRRAEERRRELMRVFEEEGLPQWYAGDNSVRVPWDYPKKLIRVVGDMVETSHGARFPLAEALEARPALCELYREARAGVLDAEDGPAGRTYPREAIKLGMFRIDHATRSGVRAGCHWVEWREIFNAYRRIEESA